MEHKGKRQRAIWMELYGLLTKIHLWNCILMICCEFSLCNGDNNRAGVELVVPAKTEVDKESLDRCSDEVIYSQTSWERYESCCQELYPGQTCPLACPCRHGSMCIPSLKHCLCKPGFSGYRCEKSCRSRFNDTWGVNCAKTCKCGPDAVCDQFLGICKCIDENRCGQRCKRFRYGPKCERRCRTCQSLGLDCDSHTGLCDLPSIIRDTSDKCGCKNGGRCLPNGKCDCYWGFRGTFCQLACPNNFFGRNCGQRCNCGKNGVCTPDVGRCRCLDDMGYSCHERCPEGSFGPRCEYQCNCPKELQCDQQTGDCYQTKDTAKKVVNAPVFDFAPLARSRHRVTTTLLTRRATTTPSSHHIPKTTSAQRKTTAPSRETLTTTGIIRTTTGVIRTMKQTHRVTASAAPTTDHNTQAQTTVTHHQEYSNIDNNGFLNDKPNDIFSQLSTANPKIKANAPTFNATSLPITKMPTSPPRSTSPLKPPLTTSKQVNEQVFLYQIPNGSVPIDIRSQMINPVITTPFYPSDKLWGVLGMIGFLLVTLVILLAFLLLKKQRTLPEVDGKMKRPKKLVQEDNIYETVRELQRNSCLQHPLHLAICSPPPAAPNSPRPSTPTSPRPGTPTSPCPGTPLLPHHGVQCLLAAHEKELLVKVRQSNDTLPKLPARNMNTSMSMRTTTQEGVTLRAKINAKLRRPRSIAGLSGIHEGDYADAFSNLDLEQAPARFSFLQDLQDETTKKRPFYFTLEAEEQNQANTSNKRYDNESYIPGSQADREKTLELAKQGIIYSTVERKRRQKIAQEQSKQVGNYEIPMDMVSIGDRCKDSSLVRVDSKRRVVKELVTPVSAECNVIHHTYGKLQRSTSDDNGHLYGRLGPSCTIMSGSRELLQENNAYDQIVRSDSLAKSDIHVVTLEAEVHNENIYDQLDRRNKDIVMDSSGQLQRVDSKRGQMTYDRVQRHDSFTPHSLSKPKATGGSYQYDHVERKGGMFTSIPSDIQVSMEDIDHSQEHIYGQLHAVNSFKRKKPAPASRKDFGSKLLNKFKFGMAKNSTTVPRRKNVTYADFWLDFSLKKKMEEYIKATNSRPVNSDDDDGQCTAGIGNSKSNNTEATIQQIKQNMDHENSKTSDGYESVIETVPEETIVEFPDGSEDTRITRQRFNSKEINIHDELEKRYSKIQEHMQIKFQLQDACLAEDAKREHRGSDDTQYAELRSVDEQKSSQQSDEPDSLQSADVQPYDQLNRIDKASRLQRSAAVAENDNDTEKIEADYQKLSTNMESSSDEYDHLNRTFSGSKSNIADVKQKEYETSYSSEEDGYGHLEKQDTDYELPNCKDIVSPTLKSTLSIATDDGWVIVSEKGGNDEVKKFSEDGKNEATGRKRLPHQYSNTSMYEEIWPGQ